MQRFISSQLDDDTPPIKHLLSVMSAFHWNYSSVWETNFSGNLSPKPRIRCHCSHEISLIRDFVYVLEDDLKQYVHSCC